MIGWIDEKLVMWGDWSRRRQDGGLGYPKNSPTCRMAAGGVSGSIVLVESDAMAIEAAMVEVKASRSELYQVGWEWYVVGAPASSIARRLGCHRDTVYARLDALHIAVANRIAVRVPA